MKVFLITFLILNFSWAEDPPADLSPGAQKLWRFFFSDPPEFQGAEFEFDDWRVGIDSELDEKTRTSWNEFVVRPEVIEKTNDGELYIRELVKQYQKLIEENQGRDQGFDFWPLRSSLERFDDFKRSQESFKLRNYTDAEAQREAFSEVKRLQPEGTAFKKAEDFPKGSELEASFNRLYYQYATLGEKAGKSLAVDAQKLEAWKRSELKRLEEIRRQNMKRAIELRIQGSSVISLFNRLPAKPNERLLMQESGLTESVYSQDLERFEVQYFSNDKKIVSKPIGEGLSALHFPVHWMLVDSQGKTYALFLNQYARDHDSRSLISLEAITKFSAYSYDNKIDEYSMLLLLRLGEMDEYIEKAMKKLKEVDSLQGADRFRLSLSKLVAFPERGFKNSIREMGFLKFGRSPYYRQVPTVNYVGTELYWWGRSLDDNHWEKRDRIAEINDRPWFEVSDSLPSRRKTRRNPFSGFVGKLSELNPFSDQGMKAIDLSLSEEIKNTSKRDISERRAFKVSGHKRSHKFFVLRNVEDDRLFQVEDQELRKRRKSVKVESVVPIKVRQRKISIPTPDFFELNDIDLRGSEGQKLVRGKDFVVMRHVSGNGHGIKFLGDKPPKKVLLFASFHKPSEAPGNLPKKLQSLDSLVLRELAQELEEAGFKAISEALKKRLEKLERLKSSLSLEALADLFSQESIYTYRPEKVTNGKELNRFSQFARFLDEEGVYCAQCDGGNGLFREVLTAYTEKVPQLSSVQVKMKSGINRHGSELNLEHAHAVTEVLIDGKSALTLDATPSGRDFTLEGDRHTEREEVLDRSRPNPYSKYQKKLKEKQAKAREALSSLKVRPLDNSEPFIAFQRTASFLSGLYQGKLDLVEFQTELDKIFPGKFGSKGQSISLVVEELESEIERKLGSLQKMKQELRRKKKVGDFFYYLDPQVSDGTKGLGEEILKQLKSFDREIFLKHWEETRSQGPCEINKLKELLP